MHPGTRSKITRHSRGTVRWKVNSNNAAIGRRAGKKRKKGPKFFAFKPKSSILLQLSDCFSVRKVEFGRCQSLVKDQELSPRFREQPAGR